MRNPCAKQDVYVLRGAWEPAECDALAAQAEAAAQAAGGWSRQRHAAFPTRDLPTHALPADVEDALRANLRDRVLRRAAARRARRSPAPDPRPLTHAARIVRAGFDRTDDLVVRDLFIINYEARLR